MDTGSGYLGLMLSNDSESQERRNVLVQTVLACKVPHYDRWGLPLVKSVHSCVVHKVKVHKVATFRATLSPVCKKPVIPYGFHSFANRMAALTTGEAVSRRQAIPTSLTMGSRIFSSTTPGISLERNSSEGRKATPMPLCTI